MHITVFTKEACQPCKATKRMLDKLEIDYDPAELDVETALAFKEQGLGSAPVVQVDLGFGATWTWAGHSPSQIERLDHAFSCDEADCYICDGVIAA